MSETPERGWVWRSTEESREAGKVSVFAVAETFVCVVLYWVLLLWLGVTWHHWMILIPTPLVLLRSEQSVALGVKWFEAYENGPDVPLRSVKGIGIVGVSFAVAGLVGWFLADHWLVGSTGWVLLAKGMAVGWLALNLGLAVAVLGAGAVLGTVAGLVALAGIGVGYWLRAIVTRFAATMRFLLPGLVQFPASWRFSTTVSDLFHPPELIPGNKAWAYGGDYSFSRHNADGTKKDIMDFAIDFVAVPIFFVPAVLWRWAIKSTAWFYLPLLWAGRGWQQLEGEKLQIWAKSYSSKFINWFWLFLGGLSFAAVTVTLFSFQKWLALQQTLSETGAPTTFIGFLSTLDWLELLEQPWLWFYIPSYALTIFIFFALDSIAKEIRAGAPSAAKTGLMQRWMWAANARAVLTNIGLAIALWYFLDAVEAWEQVKANLAALG